MFLIYPLYLLILFSIYITFFEVHFSLNSKYFNCTCCFLLPDFVKFGMNIKFFWCDPLNCRLTIFLRFSMCFFNDFILPWDCHFMVKLKRKVYNVDIFIDVFSKIWNYCTITVELLSQSFLVRFICLLR